jgi:hypothetical protein
MREIPKAEWIQFLDEFTREHQGWQVRVEVQDAGAGPQVEADGLPLQGVAADHRRGAPDVAIIVGEESNPAVTRIIHGARRLRVEETAAGNIAALEIDAGRGSKTVVRLLQVPQPA